MKLQQLIDFHRKEINGITQYIAEQEFIGIRKLSFDLMIKEHGEAIKLLEKIKVYSDWMLREANEPEEKPDPSVATQILSAMLESIFGDRPDDHALAMSSRPVGVTPDDWKRMNTPPGGWMHGKYEPEHPRVVKPTVPVAATRDVRDAIERFDGWIEGSNACFSDPAKLEGFRQWLSDRGHGFDEGSKIGDVKVEVMVENGKVKSSKILHDVAVGQEWVLYDMRYRVEWIDEGLAGLSLPGSSQVMRTMSLKRLQRDWDLLGQGPRL